MSETLSNTNRYSSFQFPDGEIALGLSVAGQRADWWQHKYTCELGEPEGLNRALVKLANGHRYGVGNGLLLRLPDYDRESGRFLGEKALSARRLSLGFPGLEIGSPWEITEEDSPAELLIIRGKLMQPDVRETQLEIANPFPDMERLMGVAVEALSRRAPILGSRAVEGFRTPPSH